MTETKTSYRQIMKATSLFGGVQIYNILISIIRSKFVAILLGPAGMGIAGLLTSTIGFIGAATNFGLGFSSIKNISAADTENNQARIATVVITVRRWVWITGTFGTLITLIASPWLSELTFGNRDYTIAFIWLSITLLFSQLSAGQLAILQGMRKLKHLAKANVTGSTLGLLITVPLYYLYGIDAIVPVIILSSIVSLLLSWYFSKKIKIQKINVSLNSTITEGKNMLTMGFLLSISGLISMGASYLIRIYISNHGGLVDVGLYSAGFAIINTYVGLIFNAMLTDYYPRLVSVANNKALYSQVVNEQSEIAILILGPLLITFLIFINWVIILLYSKQFLVINNMMYWLSLSIFFKLLNWSIGILLIVKGSPRLYFFSDLVANIYILGLNIVGYHLGGLSGLGISFVIGYFLGFIQLLLITNIKFGFNFVFAFYKIFFIQFFIAICSFVAVKFLSSPYPYFIGLVLIVISTSYSYIELDKRVGIKSLLSNLSQKFR